jgi:hypothetical protein
VEKDASSVLVGVSPEFEIALYSMCGHSTPTCNETQAQSLLDS